MVSNDKTSYHEYRTARQGEEALSPYTCRDLNMDEVFEALDETSSCIGRQYLYHALCTDGISEVARHENLIGTLSADTALRSKLVQAIQPLNHQDAYSIPGILAEDGHRYSRRYLLLLQSCRWLPLCCLAGIFLFPYSPVPFLLLLAAYIGNAYLHFKEKNKLMDYFFSVPQLHKLLKICDKLVKEPVFSEVGDVEMKRLPTSLAALQRKLGLFRYGIGMESETAMLVYLLTEALNIFFLLAALNTVYSFITIKDKKQDIEKVFRFVGLLDVLCSVSLLRERLPYWCRPASFPEGKLHAEGVYHPLIENCIPNDLTLADKSILITGSNMSGKTSFIRTIGINLLAAKALNTCFARCFETNCNMRLYSVIHTEDDLAEGKSYFFEEAERVKQALDKGVNGRCLLLFDELFKGTNGVERIAINASVFTELASRGNLIFASTHDLRLAELLKGDYELYHFCETVGNHNLSFDYRLKPGIVKEGNAIKVLGLCGYPAGIIKASAAIVSRLVSEEERKAFYK